MDGGGLPRYSPILLTVANSFVIITLVSSSRTGSVKRVTSWVGKTWEGNF